MLENFGPELRAANRYPSPPGEYVRGEYVLSSNVPATPVPITIIKPQPITGQELEALEDGGHVRQYRKTWTQDTLKQQDGDVGPDVIEVDGDFYRIKTIEDRRQEGGALKAFMRKLNPDEPSPLDIYPG